MATNFSEAKTELETLVIARAIVANLPHCVENTGDLIKVGGQLIDGFRSTEDWFMFSVDDDSRDNITVGGGLKRIYGSLFFTAYSPKGQASTGGAKITDFIYENFQGVRIGNILLRNARKISEYKLEGWDAKTLQVSFQFNVQ